MLEKALKQDAQRIGKTQKFKAKRPIEYWLLFLKMNVLPYSKSSFKFKLKHLAYLVPIILIIALLLLGYSFDSIVPILFVSVFFMLFIIPILGLFQKQAFVPVDAFQDLAKFIIAVKGDVHRNLINLRLDYSPIENEKNLLDPNKIGIRKRKGTVYKPYKLERYHTQFIMKDGTVCTTTLNQVSVRIKTTKRRSSGKVKTKTKHKHKFFYALTLKLNATNYTVVNDKKAIELSNDKYNIAIATIDASHFVKIKYKTKPSVVSSVLRPQLKHTKSAVTEMMNYLTSNQVMTSQLTLK